MTTQDASSYSEGIPNIIQIAFQGAPGCYSQLAGHLFTKLKPNVLKKLSKSKDPSKDIRYGPCKTHDEVVRAVVEGDARFGIVPLDNSSVGVSLRCLELLMTNKVALMADLYLLTEYHLLGFPKVKEKDIRRVISHPIALKQCQKYLMSMKGVEPRPYWDTAGAAFFVKRQNNKAFAAVAGEAAAHASGLKILKKNIDDHEGTETRFGIVTQIPFAMNHVQSDFPEKPHLSCSFEMNEGDDLSSFLLATVAPFGAQVINTVRFPVAEAPWSSYYILELEMTSDKQTQAVWQRIREVSKKSRILGIYESLRS